MQNKKRRAYQPGIVLHALSGLVLLGQELVLLLVLAAGCCDAGICRNEWLTVSKGEDKGRTGGA